MSVHEPTIEALKAISWLGTEVERGGIEHSFGWPGWEKVTPDNSAADGNTPEWRAEMRSHARNLISSGKWARGRLKAREVGPEGLPPDKHTTRINQPRLETL